MLLFGSALAREIPFVGFLFGLQLASYAVAVGVGLLTVRGYSVGKIPSVPFYVLFGSVGAAIGVVDWLRGKRFDVWESASLSRGAAVTAQGGRR